MSQRYLLKFASVTFNMNQFDGDYLTAIRSITTNASGVGLYLNPRLAFLVQDKDSAGFSSMTEKMTILGDGNVGIGTTLPQGIFSVGANNQWYISNTNLYTLNTAGSINALADGWINYRGYNDGFSQPRNFNIGNGRGSCILWVDGTNNRVSINNGQSANNALTVNGSADFTGSVEIRGHLVATAGGATGVNDKAFSIYDWRARTIGNATSINFLNASTEHLGMIQVTDNGGAGNAAATMEFKVNSASEGINPGTRMIIIGNSGNVGIGTSNPGYKLSVNGTIKAREVIVSTEGWSDFVFKDDYKLMKLDALEQNIKENGHLPNIPSASEVAENGVSVGEMQSKLLQKVEELTLYVIAQNKEINALKQELAAVRQEK